MEKFQKLMFQSETFVKKREVSIDTFMEEVGSVFRGRRAKILGPLNNIRNLASFCQSVLEIRCNGQLP